MAGYPPFMNAYGNTTKILEKIKHAKTPDRFTLDFLKTVLGFKSSGARSFLPLAKRLGLLASDGSPTPLYKSFRNTSQSGAAIAKAMKKGYSELYEKNEFAHNLNKTDFIGLLVETTGLKKGDVSLNSLVGTFTALKSLAKFDEVEVLDKEEKGEAPIIDDVSIPEDLKLNLSYTINLVLPKTDDAAVFNAIFKSLKDNLLRK